MNAPRAYLSSIAIVFGVTGLSSLVPALAPENNHGQLLFGFLQTSELQIYLQLFLAIAALFGLTFVRSQIAAIAVQAVTVGTLAVAIWGVVGVSQLNLWGTLLYLMASLGGGIVWLGQSKKPKKRLSQK